MRTRARTRARTRTRTRTTFRDYDNWDAIPEEDIRALGESVLVNLKASMTEAK